MRAEARRWQTSSSRSSSRSPMSACAYLSALGLLMVFGGNCAGGTAEPGDGTGGANAGTGTGGATAGTGTGGAGTGGATTGSGGRAGTPTGGGPGTGTGGRTGSGMGGRTGGTGMGGRAGGTGGASSGGTGGATGAGGASAPTAGCNAATWPPSNDQSGGTPVSLDVGGTQRQFYVSVPTSYSSAKPTRVVFAWHWRGGNARNVIGNTFGGGPYYGLKSRIPDAIFVSAEGLVDNGVTGWANTSGRDVNFLKAMLTWLDTNYCVDKTRIFSTGFSYGGIMSNTIACQLGSTFRAIAPVAGSSFGGARGCVNQKVAALMIHGTADDVLTISGGQAARDYHLTTNNCTMTTMPSEPSPCVTYSGCDAGYPVVWCEHTGGHTVPSFAPNAIAPFFLQF